MTPWHRFWFPHGDESPAPTRDAALWTPQAIAETQRAMWQHMLQATEDWWRFVRAGWPNLPVQPPAGQVVPPPDEAEAPAPVVRKAIAARRSAAKAAVPPRPRRAARGK
jgi:hypothetical protein